MSLHWLPRFVKQKAESVCSEVCILLDSVIYGLVWFSAVGAYVNLQILSAFGDLNSLHHEFVALVN